MLSNFIFKYFIHLKLVSVYCAVKIFSFPMVSKLTQFYLLNSSSPHWFEMPHLSYVKFIFTWACFCSLCTVSLIYLSIPAIKSDCLNIYKATSSALHIAYSVAQVPPHPSIFFKIFLAILKFQMNFSIIL